MDAIAIVALAFANFGLIAFVQMGKMRKDIEELRAEVRPINSP